MDLHVRRISALGLAWRVLVGLVGIGLLVNGSARMHDDVWPFGPMSQYADSKPRDDVVDVTRVEGLLTDGHRIDLPLRVSTAGISRAEIEAQIPAIEADPSLLRAVADGWGSRHADAPPLVELYLVQDRTQLVDRRPQPEELVTLTTWTVPR